MPDENRKSQISNLKSKIDSRASIAEAEIIETQDAAALFVGRNARTIRRWEKEGMLTAIKDGHKVYIRSQLKLFAEHEGKQPTKTKMRKEESEASLKQTKAEDAIIDLQKKKELFVSREEVEKKNIRKILAVKSGIFSMIRNIVAAVPAEHRRAVQKIAEKEARSLIEGFRR